MDGQPGGLGPGHDGEQRRPAVPGIGDDPLLTEPLAAHLELGLDEGDDVTVRASTRPATLGEDEPAAR